jgi:hypothetical protein
MEGTAASAGVGEGDGGRTWWASTHARPGRAAAENQLGMRDGIDSRHIGRPLPCAIERGKGGDGVAGDVPPSGATGRPRSR